MDIRGWASSGLLLASAFVILKCSEYTNNKADEVPLQQPVPPFPARLPQRGLGRSRWSSHGTCMKEVRLGDFSPQFWGPGLWQTPKRHQTKPKRCAPELLTIRSGVFRNIWYLDTHTLSEQALTSFTTYLEKTGSISSGLGSLHQHGPGSSLCYSFPNCPLRPPCNSIHRQPPFPTAKSSSFKGCLWDLGVSEDNYQMLVPEYPSDLWH